MNCRRGGHESIDNLSTIRKNLSISVIVKSDDLDLDYLAPKAEGWSAEQLSKDLMAEFPDMKGFSRRNLEIVRRWYLFYSQGDTIAKQPASQLRQQPVAILARIPWGHNLAIISKCSTVEQALFYVQKTVFDFLTLTEDYTIHKPMGVSEYELVRSLPDELKSSLPTIKQIEAEFEQNGDSI